MAKLGSKGPRRVPKAQGIRSGGGVGAFWGQPRPPEAGEYLVLICALWGYMLFHPAVECILNLQGVFKSEVPVVIFLHLVLKIK